MDGVMSASDQQMLVSSFLEIAVGQTADTARQFLQVSKILFLDLHNINACVLLYLVTDYSRSGIELSGYGCGLIVRFELYLTIFE